MSAEVSVVLTSGYLTDGPLVRGRMTEVPRKGEQLRIETRTNRVLVEVVMVEWLLNRERGDYSECTLWVKFVGNNKELRG